MVAVVVIYFVRANCFFGSDLFDPSTFVLRDHKGVDDSVHRGVDFFINQGRSVSLIEDFHLNGSGTIGNDSDAEEETDNYFSSLRNVRD